VRVDPKGAQLSGRDFTISEHYLERFRDGLQEVVRWWNPRIQGVEVTQSIQHYRSASHLSNVAQQGADNSLRLVANKPAWVRVYVRRGLFGTGTVTLSGTLEVHRRHLGFLWVPVATINPRSPGSVTAPTATTYDAERSSVANTLNFVIPSNEFRGYLRLTVKLTSVGGGDPIDTEIVDVDACLRQTLRIRGIMVSYNGASTSNPGPPAPTNITIGAPTLANLQTTAARAQRMMPVQTTGSFASAGSVVCDRPLDDPRSSAGGCSTNWGRLLNRLTNQRTADGNRADVVYYGLLPTGIPLNVPGCGRGGLGSGVTNDQGTFVHEIGHGYGFAHTPCGNVGTPDPNYPNYQPHPMASIGEYGLDISNGNVFRPQAANDYMSYCGPPWMSIYQHNRLIQHARLGQEYVCDEPWWKDYLEEVYEWRRWPWPDPPPWNLWKWIDMNLEPIISITGIVHSTHEIEVDTVARVSAATGLDGVETDLTAVLLDENGERLAQGRVVRLRDHGGCGCGGHDGDAGPYSFQVFISDVAPGGSLVIHDADGEEIWSRRAPEHPPRVGEVSAEVGKDAALGLHWEYEVAGEQSETWAQWSADGEHWRGLAVGLVESGAAVPIDGLPAGKVLVRVLVHDGFSTAVSEPAEIHIPERPPVASIMHPRDGQTLLAGQPMQLWAAVADQSGEPLGDEGCKWILDGDDVGEGKEVWLDAPRPGEHELILLVVAPGEDARASVRFTTVGPDHEDVKQESAG